MGDGRTDEDADGGERQRHTRDRDRSTPRALRAPRVREIAALGLHDETADCAVRATQVGEGVGPIYDLPRAIAKQVDGHRQSAPCPSFTRHSRWAAHEAELRRNTVPGPGYYG